MDTYTGCLVADKAKFIALLDADLEKLKEMLEKAKTYHHETVSEIESI